MPNPAPMAASPMTIPADAHGVIERPTANQKSREKINSQKPANPQTLAANATGESRSRADSGAASSRDLRLEPWDTKTHLHFVSSMPLTAKNSSSPVSVPK